LATLRFHLGCIAFLSLLLAMPALLGASTESTASQVLTPSPDANALMRQTVQNEVKESSEDHAHFLFRSIKTSAHGSVTKVYVETREGTAGMIVAYDGRPLSPDQRKAEEARVERFIHDPDELKKKRKQEQEDNARTMRIVRALPDAFIFQYSGEQPASPGMGSPGSSMVKLTFHPNPAYDPPSHLEQVLTGMEGYVLVDRAQLRLALIDGTLFKEVSFGWGFLGHLDKGGHFVVAQQMAGDGTWEVSRMSLNITGRILLARKLVIKSEEIFSDFKPVAPNLTFAQAFEMLKKEQATLAENTISDKTPLK
jgi:hypothetical protein